MRSSLAAGMFPLVWALAVAAPTAAQRVRVDLHGETTSEPLQGLLVSLLDKHDSTVAEGLTDAAGERLLTALVSGTYRVRVRRIGFAPVLSDPIELTAGEIRALRLNVPSTRVTLATVTVTEMRKACAEHDQNLLAAAQVWEQIRTALAAGEVSRSDSLVRTRVVTFERELSPGGVVRDASSRDLGLTGTHPFATPEPPALSQRGYVVTDTANVAHYYGPHAQELLSSEFGTDHCFSLVAGGGSDSALIGLAFRPVRNRGVPEIDGALWIDKTTLELRSLEFQYVNAHFPVEVRGVGGRLEFERVQSGAWYPRYWMLRMPRFRESAVNPGLLMLAGYVEMGATATPVGEVDVRAVAAGMQAQATAAAARVDTIDVVTTAATVLRPGAANGPNTIAADRASCGKSGSAGVPTATGIVRDDGGAPVPFASIGFADGYQASTISERTGCFLVRSPKSSELTLVVRRIGFHEVRRRIGLTADSTVFLDVRLTPIAVSMPGVTVTAPRTDGLEVTGFYDRLLDRKKGIGDGWFIMPEEIERRNASRITQLLGDFPSITLLHGKYTSVPMGKGGTCVMSIYVDGARFFQHPAEATLGTTVDPMKGRALGAMIAKAATSNLDGTITPNSVAAIEIYPRAAEAPPRFQSLNGACGVIVVWTKR